MARTILKGYQFQDKSIDLSKIQISEALDSLQTSNINNTLNESELDENSVNND